MHEILENTWQIIEKNDEEKNIEMGKPRPKLTGKLTELEVVRRKTFCGFDTSEKETNKLAALRTIPTSTVCARAMTMRIH